LRWAPFNTGHLYSEHRSWIEQALTAAEHADVADHVRARGIVSAGAVAGLEGRSADAIGLLQQAVDLLDDLQDDHEIIWCHMWLGAFAADNDQFADAIEHTQRGLALAHRIGSTTGTVYLANQHAENNIAAAAFLHRPECLDEARSALTLAASASQAAGIEEGLVRATNGLAILRAPTDPHASLAACQDALATWRRLGSGNRLIMSLVSASRVAILADDHETSARLLIEAIDAISAVGWTQPIGRLLEAATVLAVLDSQPETAALLTGAGAARFMTPRWYVDISVPLDAARSAAQVSAPEVWESGLQRGAGLTDDEIFDILRVLAAS
jgi:tetratricopeptide (TPR) repeat protein